MNTSQRLDELKIDLGIEEGTLSYYNTVPYLDTAKIVQTKKNIKNLKQTIKKLTI